MQVENSPPMGIKPKHVWEEDRFKEVMEACKRYSHAKQFIPNHWFEELLQLYEVKGRKE